MTIVNRTPDWFHDPGRTYALEKATEAVRAASDTGADWIDIGVRSRPVREIGVAKELDRVLPVVEAARDLAVSRPLAGADPRLDEIAAIG